MNRRSLALFLLCASAFAAADPALAAGPVPDVTIENVRVGFGEGLGGGRYKSGTWTPVWVDLKAGAARFQGFVEITAPDDNSTPTNFRRPVDIAPHAMATVALMTRPGSRAGDIDVRVVSGRRVKATWVGGSIESVGPEIAMILTAGRPQGVGEIADLARYAGGVNGLASHVVVVPVRPRDGFPARWYGLDALDAVVVDTNDPATMTRLRESKGLIDWVRQGGHLVIAVGQNWQAIKDSPLAPLLPAVPAGRVELNDPGLLDQFAGSVNKPLIAPDSREKLMVTKFEGWEARGGVPLAASSATPLVLRGPYGFGRVTMVGLDVDQKPFASWDDKKVFWDKLLDLRGRGAEAATVGGMPGNAFYNNGRNDLSGALFDSLERFPGVRLVPFGWVAFFVFVYVLLIGPGDYFFLRKVVKRMELTWITFPLIVVVVSGVAYAAAYHFKGTDLRINKADVVDVDQTTGQVRGTTWLTLFSPQNRDYDLGLAPLPPEAEPPADPLAPRGSSPDANVETLMTWFGKAEAFGGGGGMSLSGGGYDYAPIGELDEVKGVRVAIWSTKSFRGQWSGSTGTPLLEADLVPEGPDRLRGTVTNVSRRPMHNAALFFGRYVYTLNALAPGATVTLGEAQTLPSYMDGVSRPVLSRNANIYNGRAVVPTEDSAAEGERPGLLRAVMFHNGMGPRAAEMPNFALRSLDLTDQLELRRPMLVAEVDGPAALLRLGGAGTKPKMTQTTVLRVVLPLNPGQDGTGGPTKDR